MIAQHIKYIEAYCDAHKLSTSEFAEKCNIGRTDMISMVAGRRPIGMKLFARVAAGLGGGIDSANWLQIYFTELLADANYQILVKTLQKKKNTETVTKDLDWAIKTIHKHALNSPALADVILSLAKVYE